MNLNSKIEDVFPRLPDSRKKALKKIGLNTVEDLLYYFPARYGDNEEIKNTKNVQKGDKIIIYARVKKIKPTKAYYKKIPMTEAVLEDSEGSIQAVWFRQPYIAKMLPEGTYAKFSGTISERKGKPYLANPEYEITESITSGIFNKETDNHFFIPVYPESKGVTSQWIYHSVQKIFTSGLLDNLEDTIPEEILKKYSLPKLKTALIWIHSPKKQTDALSARKRFAFEEILFIQLLRQKQKRESFEKPSFKIAGKKDLVKKFTEKFPFKLTKSQEKSIDQILSDFEKGNAMSRLLEGDVGSGKTAVAATTVYAVTTTKPNGSNVGALQTAYMAPTEILAKQLYDSFIQYFSHLPINIGLITSSGCKKFPSKTNPETWTDISRTQLLKWVANGEIPILIGTHSLIQKSVEFKNLAYVIIDEQHRFGTKQRRDITKKDERIPHLLSMTATPIPRTLALTIYGDLDLTLLDEMPKGRKPVITEIVTPEKRKTAYEEMRKELQAGRQLYVICPRIDEPDPDKANTLNVKSVKTEAKRLKEEIFPEYEIDILHSKMKPKEKEETMRQFENKEIDILVSTSVVEVGVNVPNATMIVIEGAERFGLAQLHQLRGRVLRSNHQAYCFIFSDTKSEQTLNRLNALKTAENGFKLAEADLELRGSGELSGKKQWGISDIGMEAIKNIKMVESARNEAQEIIKGDPELKNYPLIKERLKKIEVHFE
ncbi:MAG: ATP-dependent DNA helicase RecG [Candidatus Pacebacteria bacterium]|nr:ATP-dependent DNA helicase RecG [Candidatus Paceibacterota bacterium]